jgi:hypothetical protein
MNPTVNPSPEPMQSENIALIELGGSHDECLYSQVIFLKQYGYRVHVLLFTDHLERMEKWPEVDCWKTWSAPAGFPGEWRLVFRVLRYLRRNRIRRAVINTAEGNIIRKLAIATGRQVEYTGLIHLARKLWTSRSQRIISRKIKKYLVLADFIVANIEKADPSLAIECFYPVVFPSAAAPAPGRITDLSARTRPESQEINGTGAPEMHGTDAPEISGKDFLVCIPGAVDYARRDYRSLLDELTSEGIPGKMRFMLLGRTTGPDGRDLLHKIHSEGIEGHFITFGDFLDPKRFYAYLSRSDLILPLITPGSGDYGDYLKYKVTGTYNLAWGFRIPMLMHESFEGYRIFRETSAFYRSGELIRTLKELAGRKGELEGLRTTISLLADFDPDAQAEKYVSFIRR